MAVCWKTFREKPLVSSFTELRNTPLKIEKRSSRANCLRESGVSLSIVMSIPLAGGGSLKLIVSVVNVPSSSTKLVSDTEILIVGVGSTVGS